METSIITTDFSVYIPSDHLRFKHKVRRESHKEILGAYSLSSQHATFHLPACKSLREYNSELEETYLRSFTNQLPQLSPSEDGEGTYLRRPQHVGLELRTDLQVTTSNFNKIK